MPDSFVQHMARWYAPAQILRQLPVELRPWLLASGSLTQQLTHLAHGCFHVEPFKQKFERIYWHESQLLDIPMDQRAWVREVYLFGNEAEPWVKARSIMPIQTLKGQGLRLRYLKTRSLGSMLFWRSTPTCIRQIALLPEGWSRRSLYLWHGNPLIVQETFLPRFQQFLLQHESHFRG